MAPERRGTRKDKGRERSRDGVAALPGSIADATVALRRRRDEQRRALLVRALAMGLVLVLVLVGLWVVWFSSLLAVRTVDVEGTSVLTPAQVRTAASAPMGTPLVRVRTGPIEDRVAALAPVKEVEVSRSWPRGLRIRVVERTASVQRRAEGGYQWSDAEGVVFTTVPEKKAGLLEVQCPDDQRLLRDVATVAAALTPALRTETLHLEARGPDSIVLTLRGGRQVIWGSAAQSKEKAAVASALLRVKATVYDVSSPANPTSR